MKLKRKNVIEIFNLTVVKKEEWPRNQPEEKGGRREKWENGGGER